MPLENTPLISAFNQYFSGGFSGLMMKEIREFRSLAYTAGANVITPLYPTWDSNFYGRIGTQGDKTAEAVEVATNLLKEMPKYPERMGDLRDYLLNSSFMATPSDRNMAMVVDFWKEKGYKEDPLRGNIPTYQKMQFADVVKFYEEHLKGKPYVIGIVGPTKKMDLDALKKFGKVVRLRSSKLFSTK